MPFTFSCSATECSAAGNSFIKSNGDFRIRGKLTYSTGGCSINTTISRNGLDCPVSNSAELTCNGGSGTVASFSNTDTALDGFLPAWFKANQWQNYVYYEMTRSPSVANIVVGAKSTEAVVVTTGQPISIGGVLQNRPSCNISDTSGLENYLDSVENTDGNSVYDATSRQRSANYNDQTFVMP